MNFKKMRLKILRNWGDSECLTDDVEDKEREEGAMLMICQSALNGIVMTRCRIRHVDLLAFPTRTSLVPVFPFTSLGHLLLHDVLHPDAFSSTDYNGTELLTGRKHEWCMQGGAWAGKAALEQLPVLIRRVEHAPAWPALALALNGLMGQSSHANAVKSGIASVEVYPVQQRPSVRKTEQRCERALEYLPCACDDLVGQIRESGCGGAANTRSQDDGKQRHPRLTPSSTTSSFLMAVAEIMGICRPEAEASLK
ncbi:hypothetical protein B0H19DRAFT_1062866 [Mycena capillaripes]|nr:hypothetical protein B0H19DRAFT_1062866 [Mycena capillaripes]